MVTHPTPLDEACEIAGSKAELARQLGVTPPLINQWIAEIRPVPEKKWIAIELLTGGRVAVERGSPATKWARIADPAWPHPQGRPCIDPAQPATPEKLAA